MKIPKNCPICDKEWLNTNGNLSCVNNDHVISFTFIQNTGELWGITLRFDNDKRAHFFLKRKEITISCFTTDLLTSIYIPFFEPDLSNYEALIAKIKTYMLFL